MGSIKWVAISLVLVLILFMGTTILYNKSQREKGYLGQFCANQQRLLLADFSMKKVKFELTYLKQEVRDYLETSIEEDCGYTSLNWINCKYNGLKVSTDIPIYSQCVGRMHADNRIILKLNREGEILFEGEIIEDSTGITEKVREALQNEHAQDNFNILSLSYHDFTPLEFKEYYLEQMIEGYFLAMEDMAKAHFKLSTCELNKSQLSQLKEKLPFVLLLDHTKYNIVPPELSTPIISEP